jgi:hypothetical protein
MDRPEKSIISGSKLSPATFTPDDVLEACGAELLNEDLCRRWLIKKLHPENIRCAFCAAPVLDHQDRALREGKAVICRSCMKRITAFQGTFLKGMHWSSSELISLLLFIAAGWSTKRIVDKLGRNDDTIRDWRNRFTKNFISGAPGLRSSACPEKAGCKEPGSCKCRAPVGSAETSGCCIENPSAGEIDERG